MTSLLDGTVNDSYMWRDYVDWTGLLCERCSAVLTEDNTKTWDDVLCERCTHLPDKEDDEELTL